MTLKKRVVAALTSTFRLNAVGFRLQRSFLAPFIRAVNYHDVAPVHALKFEAQLKFYKEHFDIVDAGGLAKLLEGRWDSARPGILLTFDDGLRSHADVVAPLLDRYGLTGWFMVPIGFLDEPDDGQVNYARRHQILHAGHVYGDQRIAMTWEDVRRLAARHEIGGHTWTHCRLGATLTAADIALEIPAAKARLERELGVPVQTFAWVGGEESSYSGPAAQSIARAGFRFSFMTNNHVIRTGADPLQLQRTNIEASDSTSVVGFQLSGALDLMYLSKRRRVNRLTATPGDG